MHFAGLMAPGARPGCNAICLSAAKPPQTQLLLAHNMRVIDAHSCRLHSCLVCVLFAAAVIIGREISMSALREWAATLGPAAKAAVAVNSWGKWKTATQVRWLGFRSQSWVLV